jgi:hypothetical protein
MNATRDHEAAHAAAALLVGHRVAEILINGPGDSALGETHIPRGSFKRRDLKVLLAAGLVAAPGGATELDEWPPSWPLLSDDFHGRRTDHAILKQGIEWLGLSREDYEELVAETREMVESPEFKFAQIQISSALIGKDRLDSREIVEAVGVSFIKRHRARSEV